MHAALRVVGMGRTASSVVTLTRICPLAPLVTSYPVLLPASTQQQFQRFSHGGGASSRSGEENAGVTTPVSEKSETLVELRKEIEEIENKKWTVEELQKEIKKVAIMTDIYMTEKTRELEDIRYQLTSKIYDFNPNKFGVSKEDNRRLKKLYNLNAKALKIGVSNEKLKTQLEFLREIVKEHERRRQTLNKEVHKLQDLVTGGVEAFCQFMEKNTNKTQEKLLNGGKELTNIEKLEKELRSITSKGNIKNNPEMEINHLKNELRYQKELFLKRVEYFNKTIEDKTSLINKIRRCGEFVLNLHDSDDIKKSKEKVVNNLKNKINEEAEIYKEMAEEKDKFKKVHSKLRILKNKLEEFNTLCENYRKEPK